MRPDLEVTLIESDARKAAFLGEAARRMGLVIDLDICVGCHACAVNCKDWNTGGEMAPPAWLQRFIITGRFAFSSTCLVTPPRINWRRRECE